MKHVAGDQSYRAEIASMDGTAGDGLEDEPPYYPPADEGEHVHWWEYGEDGDGAWEACDCGAVRAPGDEGGKAGGQ